LGKHLVEKVIEAAQPGGKMIRVYGGTDPLREFYDRVSGSEVGSIDEWLEANPEFIDLGKKCISLALIVDGPAPNYPRQATSDWYPYLWSRLHEAARTPDEFRQNRLTIITYNYDRSFERYFAGVLKNFYKDLFQADEGAIEEFRAETLPVIHLHGSLGEWDDLARTTTGGPPDLLRRDYITGAASGIRIIHEESAAKHYAEAHQRLQEAEAVHFLGFGFHPTNLARLQLVDQARKGKWLNVGGTAVGLEHAQVNRAEKMMELGSGILRAGEDSLLYLKRHAILE
jgi:hypothetical protein